MSPAQYAKIYRWFAARPPALTALRLANRWLPLASAGELLARAVLAPGAVFLGGSALRAALDRPRPYQQPGFVPLLPKDTLGRSFPSRHALSAGAIAAAWLPVCPAASALLGALTLAPRPMCWPARRWALAWPPWGCACPSELRPLPDTPNAPAFLQGGGVLYVGRTGLMDS